MGNLNVTLRALFESVGCEVTQGPRPNKKSLDIGVRYAPELVCLPFKVTLGDMFSALEQGADTLLFIGGGDWSCRYGYYGRIQCSILRRLGFEFRSIFIGHQDVKSIISEILHLNNDSWTTAIKNWTRGFAIAWHKSKLVDLAEACARTTRPLETRKGESSKLLRKYLHEIDRESHLLKLMSLRKEISKEFSSIQKRYTSRLLKIQLVGESYCVIEPFVNFEIIEYLGNQGVHVEPFLTAHRWLFYHAMKINEDRSLSRKAAKDMARPFWGYNAGGEDQLSIAYTINAARSGFDGVIHLMPFSCMPETAALPVFERVCKLYNIPFLNISLDEHTGVAGVYTRIEAFLDLLSQRRSRVSFLEAGRLPAAQGVKQYLATGGQNVSQ
jgi:predicted nucleotide-binding protein (sugar kinase/HSP70/actin superfamily)